MLNRTILRHREVYDSADIETAYQNKSSFNYLSMTMTRKEMKDIIDDISRDLDLDISYRNNLFFSWYHDIRDVKYLM